MQMVPVWSPPVKGGFPTWLLIVLIVLGALLLLFIASKVFGGAKEEPAPMPVAMPAMAPAEAPKPAGPMKTVMIGAGGDQDGFPIVGWLVPMNGVDAYKTWKLRSGLTKIGSAAGASVVRADPAFARKHSDSRKVDGSY